MKHFFKKALSLALAVLFTLGAVSATAFVGLLPAVAEDEHTLGATAACTGHTLGAFNNVPACVNANGELHICENNFPDANFRNYVSGSDFDVDSNGYFSLSEIKSIKEISCESYNIASLQGVEFFGSLTKVDCPLNPVTELNFSNNTKLSSLNCTGNKLSSLDISNNMELTRLLCSTNRLTSLDVSKNVKLTNLFCSYNKITSLDVSKSVALTSLHCYNNRLTALDVSNNVALRELSCSDNQLTTLDVSNNTEITYLSCSINQLTTLDVGNNTKLVRIYCGTQSIEIIVANRKAFDMRTLIPEENLSKVTIDSDIGTYDPETGIIVFNTEQTSFKYYYDIGKNGKTMDVTVTLKMPEHTYGDYVSNGDGTHTRHCTFDGCTDTETENCSGGAATCKDKAVCEICGEAYGELNPENHTGEEVWEQTETTHTKKWNCCGKVTVAEADHKFEDGVCTVCAYPCAHKDENTDHKCDICGETVSNHSDENHDHLCDICGKAITNHVDSNNDHVCDICGKAVSNHVDDDNNHVCDICGEAVSNHVDDDNNHLCDTCGKAISNHVDGNNDHVCDICGKAVSNHVDDDNNHVCDTCGKAISNHVDDDTDHICDICGKAVSNHVDDNKDHVCDICGKTVTNHVDDDNNHICDLCGKTVSNHSDENHDHVCDICGETVSTHTGGTATCKDKAVCEICGEEYGELDANNHTGKEVWEQTETTHTKKWNCCGKFTVEEAAHTFEHGVCTVCEYTCTHTGGTATCKDKAVCEICGEAYGELNPENHTGGTHLEHEKAATCTEKGYTGDTYCNGCNEKIADGSEIPTKPHTPGEKWVIENGKKVKKCTECGAIAETAPRMPGDVDGDGEITMLDCLYLKRYILGTFSGEIVLENADVDGNGKIDATDYLYLKRGYLGTFDLSQFA